MFRRLGLTLAAVLLLGLSAGQGISYNDAKNDTTDFVCTSTCTTATNQLMTQAQFQSLYNHGANTCGTNSATQIIDYTTAMACKTGTSTTVHTPILANNSFASASFTSWSADAAVYNGSCSVSSSFTGAATPDNDADGGGATGSTGTNVSSCYNLNSTSVTLGLAQTVSIVGTPTSQSYSFYYNAPLVQAGDAANCTQDVGTVANLIVKINGTTQQTVANPANDGAWHQVTGTTTALVNGSNTIDISVTLAGASGTSLNASVCSVHPKASQPFTVDKVALTATY